jgi:hypothetical protein
LWGCSKSQWGRAPSTLFEKRSARVNEGTANLYLDKTILTVFHVEKFSSLSNFPCFCIEMRVGLEERRRLDAEFTYDSSWFVRLVILGRFATSSYLCFERLQALFRPSNFQLSSLFLREKLKIEQKVELKVELKSLFVGD